VTGYVYVNPFTRVALWVSRFVTTTLTAPAAPVGVVQVIVVLHTVTVA
jgi:hypothetical protein